MPKIIRMLNKNKRKHNQGPNAPVRSAGLACRKRCHQRYLAGEIDEAGLEACIRACQGEKA